MSNEEASTSLFKWHHPQEIMQLHQLKKRKKALQARINSSVSSASHTAEQGNLPNLVADAKRKNPFLQKSDNKRSKTDSCSDVDVSLDATLFKIIHCTSVTPKDTHKENITSFSNVLSKANEETKLECKTDQGKPWIPIDWSLKTKIRFVSSKPLAWGQKLKMSEEASGITSFTRCLGTNNSSTTLDASSKARFHQCCLYWQQPSLPWLSLFPRTTRKAAASISSVASNPEIRSSLQGAWSDSLKSLFQLIRTKQCPYFYVCANQFTVLFRAAGICGFNDMHALVVPTTRGFRYSLKQEDIDFKMPLKKGRNSDQGYETLDSSTNSSQMNGDLNDTFTDEEESPDEQWLQSMGIKAEDIKQINYTQARKAHKAECEVDNSEESLVLIEGLEVQGFYNFLMNCKSAVALVGPVAGIPPTLLAPVAFHGASLNSLKVRESKIHVDNEHYYSLELSGPILPHTIHNLYAIHPKENSLSATCTAVNSTVPFSKVKFVIKERASKDSCNENGSAVFKKENLSDCGFTSNMLEHFCSEDPSHILNIDCLKYVAESQTYTWT